MKNKTLNECKEEGKKCRWYDVTSGGCKYYEASDYFVSCGFVTKSNKQITRDIEEYFNNHSDCYADTGRFENDGSYTEGEVIPAMTKETAIKFVEEFVNLNFVEWCSNNQFTFNGEMWFSTKIHYIGTDYTTKNLYALYNEYLKSK